MQRSEMKVLIVEDEEPIRKNLAYLLHRHLGFTLQNIIAVGTVNESKVAITSGKFHLVISDFDLPDGIGPSVLLAARHEYGSKVILFIMSGQPENFETHAEKLSKLDGVTKFSKPFSRTELDDAITAALEIVGF